MAQISRHLRNENRVRVYKCLLSEGVCSRAEIARKTGMSGPTVMRIIDELLESGIVFERETDGHTIGRKPIGVSLASSFAYQAAILHEGDLIQAGLVNMSGEIVLSNQALSEKSFEAVVLKQIPALIDGLLRECEIEPQRLIAVGIGLPAVLDPYSKRLLTAPLIHVPGEMDLSGWLSQIGERYGASTYIENDVNLMAIGEHFARGLGSEADIAYISIGTGVGAGMILRGEIRRGKKNRAGEIGYLLTMDNSQKGLEQLIGRAGLLDRLGVEPSESNTEREREVLIADIARIISPLLVNMALAFDLDLIVLGGYTTQILGEDLVEAVRSCADVVAPFPVQIEKGILQYPGIEGMGRLLNERFLQRMEREGLDSALENIGVG